MVSVRKYVPLAPDGFARLMASTSVATLVLLLMGATVSATGAGLACPDWPLCFGTVLSRSQYLPDLDRGDRDARLRPVGTLSPDEVRVWTDAADEPRPRG